MRKIGTILSPECKSYAKDIETISEIPANIALQLLRLIESIVCQRLLEKFQESKRNNNELESISVEIPLMGNLIVTPQIWHKHHLKTDKPSIHFDFAFEPFTSFKNHISKIYNEDTCELISLLSKEYAEILVKTYKDLTM